MSPKPAPKPSTLEPTKAPRRPHPMAIMADHAPEAVTPTIATPAAPEPEEAPVRIQAPPRPKPPAPSATEVKPAPEAVTQRLTVDVPVGVARRIKALASMRGEKLNMVVSAALQNHLDAADEVI